MAGRRRMVWVVLAAVLLLLAGCAQPTPDGNDTGPDDGMDGGDGMEGGDGMDGDDGERRAAALAWRDHAFLGSILTDRHAMTVYIFTPDPAGESTCTGGCAEAWPPVPAENGTFTPAELEDRVSTLERPDGTMQLALDGRPLYTFAGDEAPGDANGQGRAGAWYVIRQSDAPGALNADVLDGPGEHNVTGTSVDYGANTTGYLAQPEAGGSLPGVVMIHEWWGLNDNIRRMAEALASHGYHVLAVDLFNGSVASTAEGARAQVQGLDQQQATANMQAAADHLRAAGATSIASLGWCFGGGQSLQLALSGEDLSATVLYYGTPLVTDKAQLEAIDGPVLGIFGDEDQAIPTHQVITFEENLTELGIDNQIEIYEGVGHAFANPSGEAYAPEDAMDAWAKTLAFLGENA